MTVRLSVSCLLGAHLLLAGSVEGDERTKPSGVESRHATPQRGTAGQGKSCGTEKACDASLGLPLAGVATGLGFVRPSQDRRPASPRETAAIVPHVSGIAWAQSRTGFTSTPDEQREGVTAGRDRQQKDQPEAGATEPAAASGVTGAGVAPSPAFGALRPILLGLGLGLLLAGSFVAVGYAMLQDLTPKGVAQVVRGRLPVARGRS